MVPHLLDDFVLMYNVSLYVVFRASGGLVLSFSIGLVALHLVTL